MDVEWLTSRDLVDYKEAVEFMASRVESIIQGNAPELVWLLEHASVYTAGTSASPGDLLLDNKFPVVQTTRGGKYYYHGEGQRVIYVMLNLKQRNQCDVRAYVRNLGTWVVNTLAEFSVDSFFSDENIGIWVKDKWQDKKIAAFGIRLRQWVTSHGIAVNIRPNLQHYEGIVPCGIRGAGVTSMRELGIEATFDQFDEVLRREFYKVFHC
ncbi:lipoyl(octanoyl) transferase LipB [Candidatus Anaplasma sp. TIGMIC]|uniref:lipoyl(octanoyl) transferase LipB n=1 Tax=Candidatus Anaplasma sp. TIGMIC TaxID=3020713 RepID=UPI00232C6EBC|nr:lipoyl(octanoyl) transferase LipB [Candidatus Anaplasma sp. TIGMIC]MDB1135189.1 lipoyl(octanoyl) transferase LipB [Candidatus Anaplasma sp. TIGMIC]